MSAVQNGNGNNALRITENFTTRCEFIGHCPDAESMVVSNMDAKTLEPLRMPISKFIMLSILTLGVWVIYWYIRNADVFRISKKPAIILLILWLGSLLIKFMSSSHSWGEWAWQTYSILPYDLHGAINLALLITAIPIWRQSLAIIDTIRGGNNSTTAKDVVFVMLFESLYLQYVINRHTTLTEQRTDRA